MAIIARNDQYNSACGNPLQRRPLSADSFSLYFNDLVDRNAELSCNLSSRSSNCFAVVLCRNKFHENFAAYFFRHDVFRNKNVLVQLKLVGMGTVDCDIGVAKLERNDAYPQRDDQLLGFELSRFGGESVRPLEISMI